MMIFPSITAQEFGHKMKSSKDWLLIDVRTPAEFSAVHVDGAVNIPTDQLNASTIQEVSKDDRTHVFVVCQSGGRSRKACQALADAGVEVTNVDGGTTACIAAGLPIRRGRGVIGVDRQVRIAAGSLVLLGIMLGFFFHPAGFGLSAFVGAGLVFAGVTDTCGMAIVLSAMPWNRKPSRAISGAR